MSLHGGIPDPLPDPSGGRRPSTLGGLVYLLVCAAGAVGLALVAFGPWRRGVMVVGTALILAGGVRIVLSDHEAGMLRVRRSRWVDAFMLVGVGSTLILLAGSIPDQPGL